VFLPSFYTFLQSFRKKIIKQVQVASLIISFSATYIPLTNVTQEKNKTKSCRYGPQPQPSHLPNPIINDICLLLPIPTAHLPPTEKCFDMWDQHSITW
jgi:hypothetical protein